MSDSSGGERLGEVPAGEHTLRVSTVGYRMLSRPFTIAPGEAKDFDIMLTPDVLRRTETVEVRAGPFEVEAEERPSRIALAGTEAKNLASVLADDPLRAVQALPGVASNDAFDARFSMRGADYHRVGLYYDGILMHSPFHALKGEQAGGSLTVINGDMPEEMALESGAFAARFVHSLRPSHTEAALPGRAAGLTRPVSPALCCSCSKSLSRKRVTCSRSGRGGKKQANPRAARIRRVRATDPDRYAGYCG